MLRAAGLGVVGFSIMGALAMLGSDQWLVASYGSENSRLALGGDRRSHGDEDYWLAQRRVPVEPASNAATQTLVARTFEVGTRLDIAGSDRLTLDIIAAVPTAADSGLVDAAGRPLILVTARERGAGTRLIRFLVEADRVPAISEKSL